MINDMKVVVIGLDGATWDLIKRWADQGELPNVQEVDGRGCFGGFGVNPSRHS